MMKYASEGNHFKCSPDNFVCGRSKKALGITPNDTLTSSGQIFYSCDLYSTRAIAKQAQDATLFIEQSIYGIEVAPLDEISDPDIVIFFWKRVSNDANYPGIYLSYGSISKYVQRWKSWCVLGFVRSTVHDQ